MILEKMKTGKNAKFLFKKENGFTLLELMVSVAIISILSVFTIVNVRAGKNYQALLRSAQTFAYNIKKVQNLALSPKKYGTDPVCFYGIDIQNNTTYRIYYRDEPNCSNLVLNNYRYINAGVTPVLETIKLESGIRFAGGSINHDMAFKPPEPIVIHNRTLDFADQTITLQIGTGFGGNTKNVVVNKFGNVEVQ